MKAPRRQRSVFDLANKKTQIDKLEAESMAEDFWADNRKAQTHMQQLNALREEVTIWEEIAAQVHDSLALAQWLEEEPDEEMQAEIAQSVAEIEQKVASLQFSLMLSGG